AVIEGAAVGGCKRAEGGLVEDAFEALVAAGGPSEEAGFARLPEDWGDACGSGESVGRTEAGEIACLGDEFGGEDGPHAGQALDEGRIRVAGEPLLEFAVDLAETRAGSKRFLSELADERGSHGLPGNDDGLGAGACEGLSTDGGTAAACLKMAADAFSASATQLGGSNVAGQQVERHRGGQIQRAFESGEDACEQIAQACDPLGLS